MTRYIYDTSWEHERARLAGLEAVLDPATTRHLATIGVADGWRCLEVGGGGGSIAQWLCDRVGPAGHVVATDLDPRFLLGIDAANLEVRTHDAVKEEFEIDAYDLVHSRDVLEHIPERLDVLRKLVGAVKPGGWLLIEDVDFATGLYGQGFGASDAAAPLIGKLWQANEKMMTGRGIDGAFGRRLPQLLLEHGLQDVQAEARATIAQPGSPQSQLMRLASEHLGPLLLEHGMTHAELDELQRFIEEPFAMGFVPLHVSAWGRKGAR